MNPALRTVLALLFVAGIGFALAQPALRSDEGATRPQPPPTSPAEPSVEPTLEPSEERTPEPTPEPSPTAEEGLTEVVDLYPRHCLQSAPDVAGTGTVAAFDGGRIRVVDLTGSEVAEFAGEAPLQWSPSGRYLASGGDSVFDTQGDFTGPLLGFGLRDWTWSPIADCVVGIVGPRMGEHTGEVFAGPPGKAGALLIDRGVFDISLSPDGTRMAFVLETDKSIWIADLQSGRVRRVASPKEPAVHLGPWEPDSRHVYYFAAPGESVLADGAGIRIAPESPSFGDETATPFLAYADYFERCGDSIVAVNGGGRDSTKGKRLVALQKGSGVFLTDPEDGAFATPTCSTGNAGVFIAASKGSDTTPPETRRLFLLTSNGDPIRGVTTGDYADEYPDWGPGRTGIVFVRRPLGDGPGAAQVWYLAEGAPAARSVALAVKTPADYFGHFDWRRVLDWSATPPSGWPLS